MVVKSELLFLDLILYLTSLVSEFSVLPAPYTGLTRGDKKRVQDNLHAPLCFTCVLIGGQTILDSAFQIRLF